MFPAGHMCCASCINCPTIHSRLSECVISHSKTNVLRSPPWQIEFMALEHRQDHLSACLLALWLWQTKSNVLIALVKDEIANPIYCRHFEYKYISSWCVNCKQVLI